MKSLKGALIRRLLNLLYPSRCPDCGKESSSRFYPFCNICWSSISPFIGNRCSICSIPLPEHSTICGECIQNRPFFNKSFIYGLYDGLLKEAIHHLKYFRIRGLARPLADLLLRLPLPEADIIVPVPPDRHRLRKRHFNHTSLIAKVLSKSLQIPFSIDAIIKIKSTPPQVDLKRDERLKNLRGAFRAEKRFSGERIMLIDDVITTGVTASECSRVLLKAGASCVYLVALARSSGDLISSRPVDISDAEKVI